MVFTVVGTRLECSRTSQCVSVSRSLSFSRVESQRLLLLRAGQFVRAVCFEELEQIGESGEHVDPPVGDVTYARAVYGAVRAA